uniref:Methyltransferase domain-containing protein n=1 Tax=Oryza glumipatula TaxID=40148 RepID=A0A0D9YB49_9ORYZ
MGYLWRVRLSSFLVGTATASAAGFFFIYKDHLLARAAIARQVEDIKETSEKHYESLNQRDTPEAKTSYRITGLQRQETVTTREYQAEMLGPRSKIQDRMAGLFTRQAAEYAAARPVYPKDLFVKLASLTAHHRVAWDVGTGNGQAAIGVAEHYDSVVATDVSAEQLRRAVPHPKVRYLHTPDAGADDDDLVAALGGEGCVDLITVAEAAHWFDLPAFYGAARRLLRKPGGVIAVWGYNYRVSPVEDMMARFLHTTLPYWDSRARYVIDGYRDLPFPFDGVGLGKEGEPAGFDMEHEMAFPGLVRMLRSWSAVATARQRGVDLLDERVVRRLEEEWGGASLVRKVTFKAFLLAGTVRADDPA